MVGEKVWVLWREKGARATDFVKATIHATRGGRAPAVCVMPEGATRESEWILRRDWEEELRKRTDNDDKPQQLKAQRARSAPPARSRSRVDANSPGGRRDHGQKEPEDKAEGPTPSGEKAH